MISAEPGHSRLEFLGHLQGAFPLLPAEALLKEDLLTEGVEVAVLNSVPGVVALEGGPNRLRRVVVQVRPRRESPYRLLERDGALTLVDARSGERLALARAYPRRPGYQAKIFPSGRAYTSVLDSLAMARLSLAQPLDPLELAEAVAETFLLEPWETGERPLAVRLLLDDALAAGTEAQQDAVVLPAVGAIRERIGNIRPLFLASPPRPQAGERRLLEAGVTGRHSALAGWGREAFARSGLGASPSWDEWLERILSQVYIFVTTNTQPVLAIWRPGSDPSKARQSVHEGIQFLLKHHVLVRLRRAAAQPDAALTTTEVLAIDQVWYEAWQTSYADEPGGEMMGPGQSRDTLNAALDVGRGAPLAAAAG